MSKSYEDYKLATICKYGTCGKYATHRYTTSKRLSHCSKHATAKMIPSPLTERCVVEGCILIALYKYQHNMISTHCYYHSYDGQICEPVVCCICGTVASYRCSKTELLYCRADHTPTCFNMKIDHCRIDVHKCAKRDLMHCKKTTHKCVVKNCKSMAGHYVYNVYKTHCYRHSSGDYVAYIESLEQRHSVIPPVEIVPLAAMPVAVMSVAVMPVEPIKPIAVMPIEPIKPVEVMPVELSELIKPVEVMPVELSELIKPVEIVPLAAMPVEVMPVEPFNPDDLFV